MNAIMLAGLGSVFNNLMNTIVNLLNQCVSSPTNLITTIAIIGGGVILVKGMNKGPKGTKKEGTTNTTKKKQDEQQ